MLLRRRWMVLAGVAGLAIGVVTGLAGREMLAPSPAPISARPFERDDTAPWLGAEVDRLRAEVSAQRALTGALQAEVTRLRERVDETLPDDAAAAREGALASADSTPRRPDDQWFEPGLLLELDMDPDQVSRIRRHFDAHQLEILFLRDRATREGWMHQPRFANELHTLRSSLREEAGDADFEALLWATGSPNRVELSALLGGSPAIDAGLEGGDIVLRYDDREIFDPQSLQLATRDGESGSTVAVDVLRGEEELRLYLPRGPLGAQLRPVRAPPRPE